MVLLRSLIYWLFFSIVTPLYALLCFLILPLPPRTRVKIISTWCVTLLWLLERICGLKYQVTGRENIPPGPAMIMCKHQSAWETLGLQLVFPPMVFVVKRELFKIPFFGWGLRAAAPIAIDRSARAEAQRLLMEQGRDRVAAGLWIAIFPEGTRIAPGQRGKYKQGGARLASSLDIPIVPVAVNAGEFWPRNSFLKYPGVITMAIGPVIETTGRTPDELMAAAETWIETEQSRIEGAGPCFPGNEQAKA
ncbi:MULTISPECIES: lysophospholipid acyltransferase family protein [Silvimonas]|uniref:lysophospholipid acyltransferase family protein n=1 Tax=Silvimonas TaxID=300264 RepID=UPI0024B33EB2|nr:MULTISPECIES: lysophospholipid acyltransferase family protein [Silvimonas]MDR3425908.1 lysophospholipid acyltransferase family protein [Silvimonas sp.]